MPFRFARGCALLLSAIVLVPAGESFAQQSDSMGQMTMAPAAEAAPTAAIKAGDLDLSGGYIRAMLPGQPVGGGYLVIHNGGEKADRLVSVSSTAAGIVELHEMTMKDNIMRMRQLKDGIPLPPGATVRLAPNGLHMMFKKVEVPFAKGATVPVILTFERAGRVSLALPVVSPSGN